MNIGLVGLAPLVLLVLFALGACSTMQAPPSTALPTAAVAPAASAASAASAAAAPVGADFPAPTTELQIAIESTRSKVRSSAEWLARGVDSWFGDKPFEDGGTVTDGRASLGLAAREGEDAKLSLRFNARFRLPNFEQQTYLFLGRDNPRELVSDQPGALSNQQRLLAETRQDRSFFAGLGRDLSDAIDLRLGFRGVKPYAQARYRQEWSLGDDHVLDFRQTLFWTLQDRFGSTTALSWERAYTPTLAARWLGAATITRETRKFSWSSILGGYQSFGDRRVLALEALVSGEESSGVGASDYGIQTRWTQPIFQKRLFGELIVGSFWPRKDTLTVRGRVWALGGNLKMEF